VKIKSNDSKLHSFDGEKERRGQEALDHDKRQRRVDNQGGYQHDDAARQLCHFLRNVFMGIPGVAAQTNSVDKGAALRLPAYLPAAVRHSLMYSRRFSAAGIPAAFHQPGSASARCRGFWSGRRYHFPFDIVTNGGNIRLIGQNVCPCSDST
jgi:hypothetical protein